MAAPLSLDALLFCLQLIVDSYPGITDSAIEAICRNLQYKYSDSSAIGLACLTSTVVLVFPVWDV